MPPSTDPFLEWMLPFNCYFNFLVKENLEAQNVKRRVSFQNVFAPKSRRNSNCSSIISQASSSKSSLPSIVTNTKTIDLSLKTPKPSPSVSPRLRRLKKINILEIWAQSLEDEGFPRWYLERDTK